MMLLWITLKSGAKPALLELDIVGCKADPDISDAKFKLEWTCSRTIYALAGKNAQLKHRAHQKKTV
eukprot:scaffold1450_cov170-Amphora_coffeaeformis.AAC.8